MYQCAECGTTYIERVRCYVCGQMMRKFRARKYG